MGDNDRDTDTSAVEPEALRQRLAAAQSREGDLVRAVESLTREQYLLRALMDTVSDHIYFKDTQSRFIRVNKSHADLFGLKDPADAVGKSDFDFFTDLHAGQAFNDEQRILQTGEPILNFEEMETWPEGRITWVSTTKAPLRDGQGRIIGTFGISRDITDRKRANEALRESEARYRAVVEDQNELICRCWPDTKLTFVNGAFCRFYGHAPEAFNGRTFIEFIPTEDRSSTLRRLESLGPWNPSTSWEVSTLGADGRPAWFQWTARALPDVEGNLLEYQFVGRDITALKAVESELRRLSMVDPLTGAFNRRQFLARLQEEFNAARRYRRPVSLLMIDADFFKKVNDTFGHDAGDQVLCRITELCQKRIRNVDVLARWGGEEFIVLLPETDREGAGIVARDLCRLIGEAGIPSGGSTVKCTVSIGVARLNDEMREPNDLIKASDAAMYKAKDNGRNRVELAP